MTEWERIVVEHTATVFRIALRMLGSVHDAEDVAQDVFCEALQLQSTQTVTDWPGMLRRMAVLRSIDRLRRTRPTESVDGTLQGSWCDPSQPLIAKELAERLRSSLGKLPETQAAVFGLACFEHLSRDEIASSLEMSPAAVSTALYKARRKLNSLLRWNYQGES